MFTIQGIIMYYQVVLRGDSMLIYSQKKCNTWLWEIFQLSVSLSSAL